MNYENADSHEPSFTPEFMASKMAKTFENGFRSQLQEMPDILFLHWDENHLEVASELVGAGFQPGQIRRYGIGATASFSTFSQNVKDGVITMDEPNDEMVQQYAIIIENIDIFRKVFDNHMLIQTTVTEPIFDAGEDNGEETVPKEHAILFVTIYVIKKSLDYEIPDNVLEECSEKL